MQIPGNVRYECVMCGKCCKALDVTVSSAFHKKASKEDWGEIHPKLKDKTIFSLLKDKRQPHTHRINHVPGKGCIFLDDDNKCIMHSAKGEAYKPIACRQFPYVFTETPGGTHVGCRFNCTSMKEQTGTLISLNKQYISKLHKDWALETPPYKRPKAIVFSRGMETDWKKFQLIHNTVLQIMDNENTTPLVALILIGETISSLRNIHEGQGANAIETDHNARLEVISKKYDKVRPNIIERVLFNQYLNIFLYPVKPDFLQFPFYRRVSFRLRQFWGKMLLAFNMKKITLPDDQKTKVRKSALWRVSPEMDERTTNLLKTYLRAKIESHQFYGKGFFGYSYSDGFNCLIATYASIIIIARLHASVRQSNLLEYSDVASAIEEVDFSYGFNEIYNTAAERGRISMMCKLNTPAKVAIHFSSELNSNE